MCVYICVPIDITRMCDVRPLVAEISIAFRIRIHSSKFYFKSFGVLYICVHLHVKCIYYNIYVSTRYMCTHNHNVVLYCISHYKARIMIYIYIYTSVLCMYLYSFILCNIHI